MAVKTSRPAPPARRLSYIALFLLLTFLLAGCAGLAPASRTAAAPESQIAPVREAALPLTGGDRDYDPLIRMIGDSRIVLLGDATHGSHELYRERARLTERLIREQGFDGVAIEGDWQDADRVNRYARGLGQDASAERALAGFQDFPGWLWANTDVRDFVQWLRGYNASRPAAGRAGFYGLDLYGVVDSADAVVSALDRIDPAAAHQARKRYGCFSRYRGDFPSYGQDVVQHPVRSCERQTVEELQDLLRLAARRRPGADAAQREELFGAIQNARVVRNGEAYFRLVAGGGSAASWNLRDRSMAATLDELIAHLGAPGRPAKIVIWAHSSHLGDASQTQRADLGELNLGQIVRQRHPDAVLVGFTTYQGEVEAASVWGEKGEVKEVRPAIRGSYTALFHEAGIGDSLLLMRGNGELTQALAEPRPERAIGVLYHPQEERRYHYLKTRLSQQFDAVVYFDQTRAVERLRAS